MACIQTASNRGYAFAAHVIESRSNWAPYPAPIIKVEHMAFISYQEDPRRLGKASSTGTIGAGGSVCISFVGRGSRA